MHPHILFGKHALVLKPLPTANATYNITSSFSTTCLIHRYLELEGTLELICNLLYFSDSWAEV